MSVSQNRLSKSDKGASAYADDFRSPRWFVMRAYKNERLAEKLLSGEFGLPHFIPKHYEIRTYHGKKQRELVPVIPSIVFVYACRADIQEFRMRFGRLPLQYIMKKSRCSSDKSAFLVVPDKQMTDFIRIASQYESEITYYSPDEIALNKGCRVRVHGGRFDGVEGVLMKVKGKRSRRVVVMLENIAAVAAAEIIPDLIEILPAKIPVVSDSSVASDVGALRVSETA
ncbi:MAG: UpxY family transcription antiterminator [Alistipes sp.]|nr:UpxY family transcription antiterminator [Alistipes senegalensis]MCM1249572.1 UpxY family transcription antiterminator [Alistipes sp.]